MKTSSFHYETPKAIKQIWDFLPWGRINIRISVLFDWMIAINVCLFPLEIFELFYIFFYKCFSLTALFTQNQSSAVWTNLCSLLDVNGISSVQTFLLQKVWGLNFVVYTGRAYRRPGSEFHVDTFPRTGAMIGELIAMRKLMMGCISLSLLTTCGVRKGLEWHKWLRKQRVICLMLIGAGEKEKDKVKPFVSSHCLGGKSLKNSSSNLQCLEFSAWQRVRGWWWRGKRNLI